MISLKKIYAYLVSIIYLSFALDSLLKIDIGLKIHVGILFVLIVNFGYFLVKGCRNKIRLLKTDFFLILFTLYIFISGLVKVGISSLFVFLYIFLALNVYFFIKTNFKLITYKVLYTFQLLMILSGLLQFVLFLVFDYQLNFLGVENHYNKGSSVSLRLRGFFVEPNWFAIAFTFNTLLLVRNDIILFFKKNLILFFLTAIVLVLNGTLGTLAVLFITYGYKYFKKHIIIGLCLVILGSLGFYLILQKRAEIKKGKSGIELFNYYSRTEPFNRVNKYFENQPFTSRVFGEGFGTWGTKAIESRLSVLNYDIDPQSRDSSELHVFLFEIGILGTLIFFLDIFLLYKKNLKENFYINGAISLFVVSFLLYPIFKFLMYMVYYFLLRTIIINNRKQYLENKNYERAK